MLIVLMLIPLFWVLIKCPESPVYLYETRDFERLRETLKVMAKSNGVEREELRVNYCMKKLIEAA